MAERLIIQRGVRKEMQNKKILGKSERRIKTGQRYCFRKTGASGYI